MLQYADYRYYVESYYDTTITEDSFPTVMRDASAFIREITANRVDPDAITDDVKDASCAVADVIQAENDRISSTENGDGREIKSENTDGYSVSYVTEGTDGQSREEVLWNKKYQAARPYLIHTGLLYLGVCADDDQC